MRSRIYVAGPISQGDVEANVQAGITAGLKLLELGYAPFVPHLSVRAYPAGDTTHLAGTDLYRAWLEVDFAFIQGCDGLLRLPGESVGADQEVTWALEAQVPVFSEYAELQAIVPPQKPDPRFTQLLGEIERLHDKKAADYGRETDPLANVRASTLWGVPAWVGALIRLNDKIVRLQQYARRGTLRNESAQDSMRDIAVYALIALLLYTE